MDFMKSKKKSEHVVCFFFVFAFLAPFWMPQVISVDIPMGFFRFGEILNFWYFWSMEPHRRRNGIFSAGNSHNCTHIYPNVLIYTHIYPYIPIYTHIYPYIPTCTHI